MSSNPSWSTSADHAKPTALVTGAAGFIGSHLADTLLTRGHTVVGVDCFTDYYDRRSKEANLAQARQHAAFRLVEADLSAADLSAADLSALLDGVDVIYHLAGQPGVRGSWGRQFEIYARNNLLATQRLLEAAVAGGKIPLVYASSSSAYGNLPTMPLQEEMTPAPVSPYGVTKLAAEHLCRLYGEVHGLPVVALRLFTVYGPRQRPDMAFQRFFQAVQQDQEIAVYGDGMQTRDFTYVGDVVRAFMLAGAACVDGHPSGRLFNIAGGSRVSLNEVLAAMAAISGRQPRLRHAAAQPGDVRDTWADTRWAAAGLGFSAQVALADGLDRQWRYVNTQV